MEAEHFSNTTTGCWPPAQSRHLFNTRSQLQPPLYYNYSWLQDTSLIVTCSGCIGEVSCIQLAVLERCPASSWLYWRGVLHPAGCIGEVSCSQLAVLERWPASSSLYWRGGLHQLYWRGGHSSNTSACHT